MTAETGQTIKGRLEVLEKALVSEENSVQYYQTLVDKTPEDTEENTGARRMYMELRNEEQKHVEVIKQLLRIWQEKLRAGQ